MASTKSIYKASVKRILAERLVKRNYYDGMILSSLSIYIRNGYNNCREIPNVYYFGFLDYYHNKTKSNSIKFYFAINEIHKSSRVKRFPNNTMHLYT